MLRTLFSHLLDSLYPPQCHFCECQLSGGRALCVECEQSLPRVEAPYCQQCGEPFEGIIKQEFSCPNCSELEHAFDFAIAELKHAEKNRDLVHALKYQRQRHLGPMMARLMAERYERDARFAECDWVLVPTPLHWTRSWKRHFNQSQDLVDHLSKRLGVNSLQLLRRGRRTVTQTRLSRKGRLKNLEGAFQVRRSLLQGGVTNVILVDDVLTTGSTAHECAKMLKREPNIEKVVVLTLLRG